MQISLANILSFSIWSRGAKDEDPMNRSPRVPHVTLLCTILFFPLLLLSRLSSSVCGPQIARIITTTRLERLNVRSVLTGQPIAWELTRPDTWLGGELRCWWPGDHEWPQGLKQPWPPDSGREGFSLSNEYASKLGNCFRSGAPRFLIFIFGWPEFLTLSRAPCASKRGGVSQSAVPDRFPPDFQISNGLMTSPGRKMTSFRNGKFSKNNFENEKFLNMPQFPEIPRD